MRFTVKPLLMAAAITCLCAVAFAGTFSLSNTATVVKVKGQPYPAVVQMTSKVDATAPYGVTGGNINYAPSGSLYFQDIYQLSVDWKALTDWGGGSPRISLAIDVDNDGVYTSGVDAWAFVYILQQFPAFNGTATNWANTGNLVGVTTGIWDTAQLGGSSGYSDYAGALALLNGKRVLKMTMVVDGGWLHGWGDTTFEQVLYANNLTVNSDIYTASVSTTTGGKKK